MQHPCSMGVIVSGIYLPWIIKVCMTFVVLKALIFQGRYSPNICPIVLVVLSIRAAFHQVSRICCSLRWQPVRSRDGDLLVQRMRTECVFWPLMLLTSTSSLFCGGLSVSRQAKCRGLGRRKDFRQNTKPLLDVRLDVICCMFKEQMVEALYCCSYCFNQWSQ